ncbi:MAG: hypothetical protein GY714_08910, partial [Desulfobacterales bacterium]|nr:hypothetical protein [Desulfobacterales bacterium]
MKLNEKKHEIAVLTHQTVQGPKEEEYIVEQIARIYPNAVVQPKEWVYLGCTFNPNQLSTDPHFFKKLGAASNKASTLRDIGMYSIAVAPEAHKAVYIGTIRPTAVFGAEALAISKKVEKRFRELQTKCLAGALKIHTGTSYRILNEILGVPSINIFILKIQFLFVSRRIFASIKEKAAHRAQ